MSTTALTSTLLDSIRRVLGWLSVLMFFFTASVFAGQVNLAWNASSGPVSGYKVYYGTASGTYPSKVDASNVTTYTVANLTDGATYYFAVKAYDSAGNESGFSNEVSKSLTVAAPIAGFSTDKTSGTAPVTVNLADTSTGTITSRAWDLGDGTNSTAQSVAKTYSAAGTYTVKLTVTNAGGSTTATKTISVTAPTVAAPVASFSATPTSGAAPLLVNLGCTSTGTITGRLWDFGDGTTSTAPTAVKTYNSVGTYTVKLTVSNAGGSTTTTKTISTTATAPVADFTASPTSGTAPLLTNFNDTSTGSVTGWSWNFGDGTTSSAQNPPAHTYETAGTYTVSLTVTGPGGTSSPKSMTVKANPSTATLPAPWQNKDIGSVGLAGSASYASGAYTLKGSGADIWDSADAFHFAYQPLNGNGTIVARVASLTNTDSWAKAGVMIRENLDANARHAMVAVTQGNGVAFQRRTAAGESSDHAAGAAVKAPYWVKLTRTGNTFTAHQSANGTTWTQIGSPVTISMATSVYVGLALTSHNNSVLATATLDNVSLSVGSAGTGALPSPWLSSDIGSVGLAGSAGYTNGSYTLKGAGADIWDSADAFRFAYQPLNGNGTIVARVASLTNTDSWAKAGVMIRESLDANARHAMVVVTSGNGVAFQRRTSTGGASAHTAGAAGAAPYWVKLVRSGSTFTAHQSANGTTWTQIGSPVTISMATSVYVGLALTSHNNGALNTAIFDQVSAP